MYTVTDLEENKRFRSLFLLLPGWVTANGVTYFRAVLTAPTVVAIAYGWYRIALTLFLIAAILDYFDGALHRIRGGVDTAWGGFIDPVADKLMVCGVIAAFIPRFPEILTAIDRLRPDASIPLPSILCYLPAGIIIAIEVGLIAIRIPTMFLVDDSPTKTESVKANWVGKVKMIVQVTALSTLMLFGSELPLSSQTLSWVGVSGVSLLLVSALMTAASLVSRLRN